jgi:hypothetical protein
MSEKFSSNPQYRFHENLMKGSLFVKWGRRADIVKLISELKFILKHSADVHLLSELGYVVPCVGNRIEEMPCVCLNFPPACEYRNCVENGI